MGRVVADIDSLLFTLILRDGHMKAMISSFAILKSRVKLPKRLGGMENPSSPAGSEGGFA
jgi:hypothetical protein